MSKEVRPFDEGMGRGEVVPQGYPSPQIEVNAARDVGFPSPQAPDRGGLGDNIIDLNWEEVREPAPGLGIAQAIFDGLGAAWDAGKPMFDHGRTELAAGIFAEHAGHVMYMHSDKEVEQPMHGLDHRQKEENELER